MENVVWYRKIGFWLFAATALIVLLPTLLFWNHAQSTAIATLRRQQADGMYAELYGASLMMQSAMDEVSDFSRQISRNEELLDAANEYSREALTGGERKAARSRLSLMLNEYVGQESLLDTVYLYFPSCDSIVSTIPGSKELSGSNLYVEAFHDLYFNQLEASLEWRMLAPPQGEKALSLLRPLNAAHSCLLVCSLKASAWKNSLDLLSSGDSDYLISSYSGKILYGEESGRVLSGVVDGGSPYAQAFESLEDSGSYTWFDGRESYQVAYYNATESSWKYLMMTPESEFLREHGLPDFYLVLLVAGALSLLLGNLLLNHFVNRPIAQLGAYMNASRNGHMATAPERSQKDEPGVLFSCYNAMVACQQQLMDEVNIQRLLRQQTQLNYLQSQMDEHFLFNTLNTIYGEACHERADNSAQMILVLSKYFRLSLSYGREKLPLNEISDLLRLYLQLQKMRFGKGLVCRFEDFPEMREYIALKYLFQPLVENAIVHGFEKNPQGHKIKIRFCREGNMLRFAVEDDGRGIEPERLAELNRRVNGSPNAEQHSFALRNIHDQLCLTYGERDILIESQPNVRTVVSFCIPLEPREEEAK